MSIFAKSLIIEAFITFFRGIAKALGSLLDLNLTVGLGTKEKKEKKIQQNSKNSNKIIHYRAYTRLGTFFICLFQTFNSTVRL